MKSALLLVLLLVTSYDSGRAQSSAPPVDYLDYSGQEDQSTGGIRMIPIETPRGTFRVWTKRVGNNPKLRLLLLHGGPGATHESFESYDGYLPDEGIEYIYYDQLDSYYSDQPGDTTLWTISRFVEEVEQVRQALGLNADNFYLLGQSWGGMLAMQYALKYQDKLKGLIITNMMASVPKYNQYAEEVLGPQLPDEVLREVQSLEAQQDYGNPRYSALLMEHYYTEHLLRKPLDQWPESINRTFKHLNADIYTYMQGPSEFGMHGNATLRNWDVSGELKNLTVPTLVIGAKHDTMDPKYLEWMANEVQRGRFLYCPNGSHLVQYDDQLVYFNGLTKFIREVDQGTFK